MENKHKHQWSDANPQIAVCTMCGMRRGDHKDLTLRTASDLTALSYGRMKTNDYVSGTVRQIEFYANQRVLEMLERIEKSSAHTQPSLHDVIESIRKELNQPNN